MPTNDGEFISYDQMEIMWKEETEDGFGNMTGPLLPRSKLNELVKYMKLTDGTDQDIDDFLDNKIRNPPTLQDYQPFSMPMTDTLNEQQKWRNQGREFKLPRSTFAITRKLKRLYI